MQIKVDVDPARLLLRLDPETGARHLAYALVNALNTTIKQVQAGIRTRVGRQFKVRQKAFIARQAAYIAKENFANVRRRQAWAELAVGQKDRFFLAGFEQGQERYPFVGKNVAMPTIGSPARRTITSKVPKRFTFEELAFTPATSRAGKQTIWVSRDRKVYLVPGVGVFLQQKSKGKSVMLYYFTPHFRLDERLGFVMTATKIANATFGRNLAEAVSDEIAHINAR